MINTILGTKLASSQTFVEGFRIPVTKITAGPCVVTQVKRMDKDGYWSVQLGLGNRKAKNITKPLQNHFKKSNSTPRFIQEIRLKEEPTVKIGDIIKASDFFKAGDVISATGVSKGKGFASGIKLHGFRGGPRTHGQSDRERAPGSLGQTTTPGRVYKGKRMAGRMGTDTVTVKNLEVIEITPDGVLLIKGLVPGNFNGYLTIKKVGENKKFVSLYKEPQEEAVEEQVQDQVQEASQEEKQETAAEVETPTEEVKTEAAQENIEEEQKEEVKEEEPKEEVAEDAKS